MIDSLSTVLRNDTLYIDNSTLEKVITCPRSAYYYIVRKRELAGVRGALNFGSAIHEALAIRYTGLANDGLVTAEMHAASVAKLYEHFTANPQPEFDEWRTPTLGHDVLNKYHRDYNNELFTVLTSKDDKPLVEIGFECPIGTIDGIKIVWTGRIDVVVEMGGRVRVMDHKTTSILGAYFFRQFQNSSQFIGYTWAAQQILGRVIDGVLINAIGCRKPTKTGVGIELLREAIDYSPSRVDEWQENTINIIANFLQMCKSNYFPMHTAWCDNKYGACPYADVCTLPSAQRDLMINTNLYKDVTWNPVT